MEKTEKIGNIILDYTCYPGEDYYCDGAVEDELLQIVQETEPSGYGKVIEEKGEWPVFYHLSPLRGNIVDWIALSGSDKVLEIGSGCGAITGTLAGKAGKVDCIDLSKKRSLINAYRNRTYNNVTIRVGNFKDIEPGLPCDYDYIFLIGVFEYGQSYIGGETPYEEFLSIIRRHIRPEGRIVIAIENKFGLKYWAGCKEDHLGTYFSGIEDYAAGGGVRTFTRNGLERICRAVGMEDYSFYYPYPDYKFATAIYSDERLPKVGELSTNLCNYDRDRMLLFDEKNAFDGIIREGEFSLFSNSYLLLLGPKLPVAYTKYSNDRAPRFAVRTDILKDREGGFRVRKKAASQEAVAHIRRIREACGWLNERYSGSGLAVNRCESGAQEDSVLLEYLCGQTLEELLDECLDRGDEAGFRRLFEQYCAAVSYNANSSVTDYDLIFSNLIRTSGPDGREQWTILDYEWTFAQKEEIPGLHVGMQDVILRALYCYSMGAWKRRKLSFELIKEVSGEEEEILDKLAERELIFQRYVTGERMALADIRNRLAHTIVPVQELVCREAGRREKRRVQIYPDIGEGFSEQTSYFIEEGAAALEEGMLSFQLQVPDQWRAVRIDPAMEACMVTVHSLRLKSGEQEETLSLPTKGIILNGDLISENTIIFATEDPNLTVLLPQQKAAGKRSLQVELAITPLPLSMAQAALTGRPKRRLFRP